MYRLLALTALVFSLAACAASAATPTPTPTYTVTFTGTGSQHQHDDQQNIKDDGTCDSAEHVDVTATLAWSSSWAGFTASTRPARPTGAQIGGSRVAGSDVKDACGLALELAPEGWVGTKTCEGQLVAAGAPELSVARRTATSLLLSVTAPPVAVPPGQACSLNVRNDQFAAHVLVPLKKLRALRKGVSLTVAVGTAQPGPGDAYAPSLDCSQPTKPYEGYRTADHCQDTLSWSGTMKVTRA